MSSIGTAEEQQRNSRGEAAESHLRMLWEREVSLRKAARLSCAVVDKASSDMASLDCCRLPPFFKDGLRGCKAQNGGMS